MAGSGSGWCVGLERGPDWLFVRLRSGTSGQAGDLHELLWSLLQQQMVYRLVLELDEVPRLPDTALGQLVRLKKRIEQQGGMLRLCGLSEENRQLLRATRLDQILPAYRTRHDAVMERGIPAPHCCAPRPIRNR